MKNRIKVLHIIHTLENGGAEKLSTARNLNTLLQVEVCSMYGNDELAPAFETEKINLYLFNRRNKYNPLIIFQLFKLIKKVQPDIVHTHLFFATVYGRIAAWLCNIPNITTEIPIFNSGNNALYFFQKHYSWWKAQSLKFFLLVEILLSYLIFFPYLFIKGEQFSGIQSHAKGHNASLKHIVLGAN